jgi:2,3-bisphosphoglycerate-dependent phosphoglycerate mutase
MLPWKGNRMAVLVLLRHGESEWNRENLFAGWANVDLTPAGELEARRAGDLLVENDLLPEVVHTSLLRRAIRTAQITLDVADRDWIPVRRSWRLNERHYGALQGKNRVQVRNEFGDEQFML